MANVNDLGVLYKRFGKYKNLFDTSANIYESPTTLKPICPTRWLCRVRSLVSVLDQYEAVLTILEEMSTSGASETSIKAAGLLKRFSDGVTILGCKIAMAIFSPLKELNRSFQSSSVTISDAVEAVDIVKGQIVDL